jgi:dihydropteroate synthase
MTRKGPRLFGKKIPLIMGILNVTPDSFSDGGRYLDTDGALRHAEKMVQDGADIIDVGGESTRPGARPVTRDEEARRILPVIQGIKKRFPVLVSVDTTKADIAELAVGTGGADIINDISALGFDEMMVEVAARYNVPVVLMHMQGTPRDMQKNPTYENVVSEVHQFFAERVDFAVARGIRRERIILDPGIGFGKRQEDNLRLIRELDRFQDLGLPILMGLSRKSFIQQITGEREAERRDVESVTGNLIALLKGASVVRVHDVASTRKSILMLMKLVPYRAGCSLMNLT